MDFKYLDGSFYSYENYFSFLEKNKNKLNKKIIDFFCAVDRYELDHDLTLHDAWLLNTKIEKFYEPRADGSIKNFINEMKVDLEFLLQTHKKIVCLEYFSVKDYVYIEPKISKRGQASDLLTHELSIEEDGLLCHKICFDGDGWIDIKFKDFSFHYIEATERGITTPY